MPVVCQNGNDDKSTLEPTQPTTPLLLARGNSAEFDQRLSQLALEWQFDGELGKDEHFDVRV